MRRTILPLLCMAMTLGFATASSPPAAAAAADWAWPVSGPVIRGFDPPDSPYGAGHRGIDIATAVGTLIVAPAPGTVSFAGPVGGKLFLTIDHAGGVQSTYSWLTTVLVKKGAAVEAGTPIATTGWGHPDLTAPHLHFGVKLDDAYVDPMDYLGEVSVSGFIRLAPVV
ncbi:MAG: murein hydrolase activator EnvC family protein [Planctomycetaceae bacterium]